MRETDDLGLSPEFLADECVARDVDEYDSWHRPPKCGGRWREFGQEAGCPGCRHCSPPDHELKPYGWGIERFEDPGLEEANRVVNERKNQQYGAYSLHWWQKGGIWPSFRPMRDALWAALTRHNARLAKCSDRVWASLCDRCGTHREDEGGERGGVEVSEGSCHARMHAGRMHTLRPANWPRGDHRSAWRWQAFIDGDFWRLFKSVKEWRAEVPLAATPRQLGPHGEATLRAVTWSEHEGRVALDRMARLAEGGDR